MDDDRYFLRDVKQKSVAHQLTMPLCDGGIVDCGEEFRTQPLNGQTAGVVVKVMLPIAELTVIKKDKVVIARLEERRQARRC